MEFTINILKRFPITCSTYTYSCSIYNLQRLQHSSNQRITRITNTCGCVCIHIHSMWVYNRRMIVFLCFRNISLIFQHSNVAPIGNIDRQTLAQSNFQIDHIIYFILYFNFIKVVSVNDTIANAVKCRTNTERERDR